MASTPLKTPYPILAGMESTTRDQLYRNFAEVERFFGPTGTGQAQLTGGLSRDPKTGTFTFASAVTFSGLLSATGSAFITPRLGVGETAFYGANQEPLETGGGLSGISMVDRDDTADRWVIYPNADKLRFYDGTADRVTFDRTTGAILLPSVGVTIQGNSGRNFFKDTELSAGNGLRVGALFGMYGIYSESGNLCLGAASSIISFQNNALGYLDSSHAWFPGAVTSWATGAPGANYGSMWIGAWPTNNNYCVLAQRWITDNVNSAQYNLISSNSNVDQNTFFGLGNNTGNPRSFFWRDGFNGSTWMTLGFSLASTPSTVTLQAGLPPLGGGNTVNIQAGGNLQLGYVSSSLAHKVNVRTLKETPEPDSGADNPVFKMRPVRFNWRHDPEGVNGVVNGETANARHPNGLVGLIAEELHEVAPDAVLWGEGSEEVHLLPPDHPDFKGPLPESHPETGEWVLHRPAVAPKITGIDHDRIVAYLVDAVQHLNETKADKR
jgi:hypothetical protein